MSKKGITWMIILSAIIVGGGIIYKIWNTPFPTLSAKAVKVTAKQLFKDFESNEQSAQLKYVPEKLDSKTLEVSGEIKDTGRNADGEIFYLLDSGDQLFGVKCIMDKENQITGGKMGSNVTIRGFCTGYNMDVVLNRCQVIK